MLAIDFKQIKKKSDGNFIISFQIETDKFLKTVQIKNFIEANLKEQLTDQKQLKKFLAEFSMDLDTVVQ